MTGFDILNITGSVRKSKQKDLFSAVTERSIMSPTLANSILGTRPGEGAGNSKCREWRKVILSPIPPLGMALQFPGSSSALPSQAPAASTSCICPFGAPSSLFTGKKQSPPLHDLGAHISFAYQDLQQPQLGLNLLVFIVFFSHRSAVFFLHVPSGRESRSWGFLSQDVFPQQPPSIPQQDLSSPSGNKPKTFILWGLKKRGANCSNKVWDLCILRLNTTPWFQMQNLLWSMAYLSEIASAAK